MNTLVIQDMTHTGYDNVEDLEIPVKLKGVSEYKLKLPEKIELTALILEIVKKKQLIIAEIKETNGRKQKSTNGKLF